MKKMLKIVGNATQYLHDAPSNDYSIRVKCITPYGDGFESVDDIIQLGLRAIKSIKKIKFLF